jgi:hypothetical protein
MKQPMEFVPQDRRRPVFLVFLLLTAILLVSFLAMDAPLQTGAAPFGTVSFELAGSVQRAGEILDSWGGLNELGGFTVFQPLALRAAFGLGMDYLFMTVYAIALSLGILLASGRHPGAFEKAGAWLAWGAILAALLDGVENAALLTIMLGSITSPWPELAAVCASIKFMLLVIGMLYALAGWWLPKRN